MTKNGNSLDQRTFGKLSRLYIIALSTIALSVIVSNMFVRQHLKAQQSDSTVINVAGRQRMLSQKLTKEILLLATAETPEASIVIKDRLKETLSLWQLSHNALQQGDIELGLPAENSKDISIKFKALNVVFEVIEKAAQRIITSIESKDGFVLESFNKDISLVRDNEGDFLLIMDQIVNQYSLEADEKVRWLGTLEILCFS